MSLCFSAKIDQASQWAFSTPFINKLVGNSIVISILIAVILLVLVLIIYPAKKKAKFSTMFKIFVYSWLSTLILIFLHDGVIKYLYKEKQIRENRSNILGNSADLSAIGQKPVQVGGMEGQRGNNLDDLSQIGGLELTEINAIDDIIQDNKVNGGLETNKPPGYGSQNGDSRQTTRPTRQDATGGLELPGGNSALGGLYVAEGALQTNPFGGK